MNLDSAVQAAFATWMLLVALLLAVMCCIQARSEVLWDSNFVLSQVDLHGFQAKLPADIDRFYERWTVAPPRPERILSGFRTIVMD